MTLTRSKNTRGLASIFNTALTSYERINFNQTGHNKTIFDKGSGTGQHGNNCVPGTNFGEWVLIPEQTFEADVKMWGGGGGAHNHSGGAAGGGGYAKSTITFYKDKPYTLWVGQGGSYSYHNQDSNGNRASKWESGGFGGGGNGGHNAGGGGGMSAIFYNTHGAEGSPGADAHGSGTNSSFEGPNQGNVILVAGGGGGAGHHGTGHHGQGGGGGGQHGHHGHGQNHAHQYDAAHAWRDGSYGTGGFRMRGGHGGAQSYTGGGGGGYWGGAGGTYRASGGHHNGGGGGSGHALDLYSTQPHWNYWIKEKYPNMVRGSELAIAPGQHQNHNPAPASQSDPDWTGGTGKGAGQNQDHGLSQGGGNGRIIIRVTGS